jgi:hypothetical protein
MGLLLQEVGRNSSRLHKTQYIMSNRRRIFNQKVGNAAGEQARNLPRIIYIGVYATFVQKLSLTCYTHISSRLISELGSEKSELPLTITWRDIRGDTCAIASGEKSCPWTAACSSTCAMRRVL